MNPAMDAVTEIYDQMQANVGRILATCTPEQGALVRAQLIAARQNYLVCRNRAFQQDDPALQGLIQQAGQAATAIQNLTGTLSDFGTVLRTLTAAVSVGSKIAERVIAL